MAADIKCEFCREVYRWVDSIKYGTRFHDWDCVNQLYNYLLVDELSDSCVVPDDLQCKIDDRGITKTNPNVTVIKNCAAQLTVVDESVSCPTITIQVI